MSFGWDGSVETSNSSHLPQTAVPGNAQAPSKQETKQVFYFEVAFYFLFCIRSFSLVNTNRALQVAVGTGTLACYAFAMPPALESTTLHTFQNTELTK